MTLASASPLALNADGARVVVDDQTLLDTWAGAYPEVVKADAPTNYWKLDDAAGVSAADAMGGSAAAITGPVALGQAGATGDGRSSMSLSGGHLDIGDGFSDFSQGLTVEAWVNPTAAGNYARIVDLGNGAAADNIVFARKGTSDTLTFVVLRGATVVGVVDAPPP